MGADIWGIFQANFYPARRYEVGGNAWCHLGLRSRLGQGDPEMWCIFGQNKHECVVGNDKAPHCRFARGFRTSHATSFSRVRIVLLSGLDNTNLEIQSRKGLGEIWSLNKSRRKEQRVSMSYMERRHGQAARGDSQRAIANFLSLRFPQQSHWPTAVAVFPITLHQKCNRPRAAFGPNFCGERGKIIYHIKSCMRVSANQLHEM